MTNKLKDVKVAFASVTRAEGHKNGKHLLGVYVDKKVKKQVEKDFDAIWGDNKSAKAKKPVYSNKDWFSKCEKTGKLIFWLTAVAGKERGIIFKQDDDADFSAEDFCKIGTDSVIDVSYDLYYVNSADYGEMVSRSIKAILLRELVPYEDDGGVGGNTVEVNTSKKSEDSDEPKEVKKDKKKKKKKKSKSE